jgi:hypothetical protein
MPKSKRSRRIPRAIRARIGYFAGLLLIATGIGLAICPGWGLTAAGAGLIAYFTLLYDVDEPQPSDPDMEVRLR